MNSTSKFQPDTVQAESFSPVVSSLERIETHISWIFLTGKYAYKVKKPVKLPFVDFSTLAKRKYFCDEELRLNKRLVDDLYIDVVPIGGSARRPKFGSEPAFEYAVRMHQFDQADRLDHLLEAGQLTLVDAGNLGSMLADRHQHVETAESGSRYGRIPSIVAPIADNYRFLLNETQDEQTKKRLCRLCENDFSRLRRLRENLTARYRSGFVRECHGDLHLANLVKIRERILPFDCLEFDPSLRWIDVMSDVAFPYMDFVDHQQPELAFAFLNSYFERSGDYKGLEVLDIYATYRALVRMKVASLAYKSDQNSLNNATRYLQCAESYTLLKKPLLVVMHGLSASGKSRLSGQLMLALGAIRIRTDVERKRLAGLLCTTKAEAAVDAGIYSPAITQQTYQHVRHLVQGVLSSGYSVIVDGTNLKKWQRELFSEAAHLIDAPVVIVDCHAPESVLRERITARKTDSANVSDADQHVLSRQLDTRDCFDSSEKDKVIKVNTNGPLNASAVVTEITDRLSRIPGRSDCNAR